MTRHSWKAGLGSFGVRLPDEFSLCINKCNNNNNNNNNNNRIHHSMLKAKLAKQGAYL